MRKYEFPILYLKTDFGNVRFWKIWIESDNKTASIYVKYGIQNGRITEPAPFVIKQAIGKKDPYTRALQLATTKWQNRIDKGYQADKFKTSKQPNSSLIVKTKSAILPMRAYSLKDHQVIFPAYVQPKIDGYRALLHLPKGGKEKYQFLSNTNKPYQHLDHLIPELKKIKLLDNPDIYLDGELYLEDDHINILRSILSSKNLTEEKKKIAKKIKFYVFDIFDLKKMYLKYNERYDILVKLFNTKTNFENIILTPTTIIKNNKNLDDAFEKYVKKGYEGIIVRNMRGVYKLRGKSIDVLKSKDIKKDKFTIVGFKEAKGNNKGTVVWEIRCNKDPRKSFWARPMGSREERKNMYKKGDEYIGKKVIVKYFEIDKNGCVTKNPVAFFK